MNNIFNIPVETPLFENQIETKILSGQTQSNIAIGTGGTIFCMIVIPSNFTGTKISFLINDDKNGSGVFIPYYNASGNKVEITNIDTAIVNASGSVAIGLDLKDFAPIQTFKIVSDVPQIADATFQLFTRRI